MLLKLLLKVMDIIINLVKKLKSLLNSDLAIFLLNFTLHMHYPIEIVLGIHNTIV